MKVNFTDYVFNPFLNFFIHKVRTVFELNTRFCQLLFKAFPKAPHLFKHFPFDLCQIIM